MKNYLLKGIKKALSCSISKDGILDFPFLQSDVDPETINPEGYDRKQKPFDPISEQSDRSSCELQPTPFDDGMVDTPTINHT